MPSGTGPSEKVLAAGLARRARGECRHSFYFYVEENPAMLTTVPKKRFTWDFEVQDDNQMPVGEVKLSAWRERGRSAPKDSRIKFSAKAPGGRSFSSGMDSSRRGPRSPAHSAACSRSSMRERPTRSKRVQPGDGRSCYLKTKWRSAKSLRKAPCPDAPERIFPNNCPSC